MAHKLTQARPYARAAFEIAKAHNDESVWEELLSDAALLMKNDEISRYIKNPKVSSMQAVDFFVSVLGSELNQHRENFLRILAEADQLDLLIDISKLFADYQARNDNTARVELSSANKLSEKVQQKLSTALEHKLKKKVQLTCKINPELIGGAILRTPEWVMDASVKAKLEQLKTTLVG